MEEEIKEVTEETSEQKGKTSYAYSNCSSSATKIEIIIHKDEEHTEQEQDNTEQESE